MVIKIILAVITWFVLAFLAWAVVYGGNKKDY